VSGYLILNNKKGKILKKIIKLSRITVLVVLSLQVEAGDVLSGMLNTADSNYSVVVGGKNNHIHLDSTGNSDFSTMGGGQANNSSHSTYGVLGGGKENGLSSAMYGVVGGGFRNRALNSFATVSGGKMNNSSAKYSTVIGGAKNNATGDNSTVAGGINNDSTGKNSFSGGKGNLSSGESSVTLGENNIASGARSIALGYGNSASNLQSIALGRENNATGVQAFAQGFKTKALGHVSVAMGVYAEANGFASFAFGKSVKAGSDGTVVFGDSNGGHNNGIVGTFPINERTGDVENKFFGFFENGYHLYTTAGTSSVSGVYLNGGSGAWNTLSDKNSKENFKEINNQEILNKLIAMPIESWNYKSQNNNIRHIGPYAQDFNQAYGLGDGKLSINTIDSDGIAFVSLQALAERNERLSTKNQVLEEKVSDLAKRLSTLENRL